MNLHRRSLLGTAAVLCLDTSRGAARLISGQPPWVPYAATPPQQVRPGPWLFFTGPEAAAVEALADRLIPPDPDPPGGKDAGCAIFIDRQLAGPYGRREGLYTRPPFMHGSKQQGPQGSDGPAAVYRKALAALDSYCRSNHDGKGFAALADADKDKILAGLEQGEVKLAGADAGPFFEMLLKDVQEGFFADPIYGGNRDMAGWRLIGYPGARYDYRDWVHRHNERFPLPPVSIAGRADWTPHKS